VRITRNRQIRSVGKAQGLMAWVKTTSEVCFHGGDDFDGFFYWDGSPCGLVGRTHFFGGNPVVSILRAELINRNPRGTTYIGSDLEQ
jgi:hypothetical protein